MIGRMVVVAAVLALCVAGFAQQKKEDQPLLIGIGSRHPWPMTFTSTSRNVHVESWEHKGEGWSVLKYVLHGGKREGVDVIVVDNGKLKITIVPTRGMGIASVVAGDLRLGWDSPVKEIVHPQHVNLAERGGLGWLTGFNEFLVRCGLEFNGHPGTDKFINNVGDEATMDLTLHGKIANIPASEVEVDVTSTEPRKIVVRGRVDERMFYGPKLELQTELSVDVGSNTFRIKDVVTSRGDLDQEFQMLYHPNFGPPLLEAGATFHAPLKRVVPFNDHAAKGVKDYATYVGPTMGFTEQVYCCYPLADASGKSVALLRNKAGDRAVSIEYGVKELPYLTLWKNTNSLNEGYVTGLEPGTGFPYNRRLERKAGRVQKLKAGESRTFDLAFTVHPDAADVEKALARIKAIQGQTQPELAEKHERPAE